VCIDNEIKTTTTVKPNQTLFKKSLKTRTPPKKISPPARHIAPPLDKSWLRA